ncbi:MAG: tRNA (adenosine(37)-N6)-threonylcarbamoyltransferase complex ATPase subunit type 1 TsaE [Lentisphaeria bacterium]
MSQNEQQVFKSHGVEETERFGRKLAQFLKPGTTVALYGDLGAGKTVLSRAIARGLGITEPVTSPTFTVVQEYQTPEGKWFYHLDMYRINSEDDALAFGIDEYLFVPDGITLIEWPERIEDLLHTEGQSTDKKHRDLVSIYIEHKGPDERQITFAV